ncbi:HPr family phosphocarrier protein [Roseospira visakhapatnamensis]|uniref:Phosphocarrier protein n=1 Tax=Roseospira visakhapatnamensis TaxID=390880 RepID=A0A7W6REJ7_9PROT|nr:phosphocarrier protein [Roseospira visakhapatnamensis]
MSGQQHGSTMADASPGEGDDGAADSADGPVAATCEIVNQRGLHARAAARFVRTAEVFEATVTVFNRGQEVSGHSIMGLMMLAAGQGSCIRIVCDGRQARDALAALTTLIAAGFDES